jgi:hypothetical protein
VGDYAWAISGGLRKQCLLRWRHYYWRGLSFHQPR